MLITASIVTYNSDFNVLKKTIDSFLNNSFNLKLFIIDNSPEDDLRYKLFDERIIYIYNNNNLGFGKAHNIGILKSLSLNSTYHLVLNPDVYFEKNVINTIVNFMNVNSEYGLLMPKILYPDGSLQYLCKMSPTLSILLLRRFMPVWVQKIFRKKLEKYEYKNYDYNSCITDVPYLSGCFMFFRNSILKQLNGFDERIFMYMEDADITIRTLQLSRTIYYPKAIIYHHFEKGSYKKLKLMLYNIHGAIIYFGKWGWKL